MEPRTTPSRSSGSSRCTRRTLAASRHPANRTEHVVIPSIPKRLKIKNKTNLGHRGFAVGSAHSVAVFSFYHRLLAVPQLGQRGCLVERGFKAVGKFIADQVRVRVAVVVSADARLVGSVDDIRGIAAGVWVNKARRHYNCPYSRYGNRDELTPRL